MTTVKLIAVNDEFYTKEILIADSQQLRMHDSNLFASTYDGFAIDIANIPKTMKRIVIRIEDNGVRIL
jgi:membrane peptidoglycan carboxypeptidase